MSFKCDLKIIVTAKRSFSRTEVGDGKALGTNLGALKPRWGLYDLCN
jgi:hypothetical protein